MAEQVNEDNSLNPDDIEQVRRLLENLPGIEKSEPRWTPANGKYVYQVTLYATLTRDQLYELGKSIYSLPSYISADTQRVGNFIVLRFY
jgi:hypothetical protein